MSSRAELLYKKYFGTEPLTAVEKELLEALQTVEDKRIAEEVAKTIHVSAEQINSSPVKIDELNHDQVRGLLPTDGRCRDVIDKLIMLNEFLGDGYDFVYVNMTCHDGTFHSGCVERLYREGETIWMDVKCSFCCKY